MAPRAPPSFDRTNSCFLTYDVVPLLLFPCSRMTVLVSNNLTDGYDNTSATAPASPPPPAASSEDIGNLTTVGGMLCRVVCQQMTIRLDQ